jgi:tRNA A-37 threonylcarbamoyl transferase component Bud32
VAIKLLKVTGDEDLLWRKRFLREAVVATKISSPHVVFCYEVGEEAGIPFLVLEYVPGGDLETLVQARGGELSVDRSLNLFSQILHGLAAVHEAGVLHRDLKPENVLIRHGHEAVLTDLGLARDVDGETLTRTGTIMGTVLYMAPELFEGTPASVASDLYSAVLIFYYMATGRVPGDHLALTEIFRQRSEGDLPGLRSQGLEVPSSLERLFQEVLHPDPRARPSSARSFLEALEVERSRSKTTRPALSHTVECAERPKEIVELSFPPEPSRVHAPNPHVTSEDWTLEERRGSQVSGPVSPAEVVPVWKKPWLVFLLVAGLSVGVGGGTGGKGVSGGLHPPSAKELRRKALRQASLLLENLAHFQENQKAMVDLLEVSGLVSRRTIEERRKRALEAFEGADASFWKELKEWREPGEREDLQFLRGGSRFADRVGRLAFLRWLLQIYRPSPKTPSVPPSAPYLEGPWGRELAAILQTQPAPMGLISRTQQGKLRSLRGRLGPGLWAQGRMRYGLARELGLKPRVSATRDQVVPSTYGGRIFLYPPRGDGGLQTMTEMLNSEATAERWESFWPEVQVPLTLPSQGSLDLLLITRNWDVSVLGGMELQGAGGATVTLPFFPSLPGAGPEATVVRIRREFLPPGFLAMRITLVGVEALYRMGSLSRIENIYQLPEGSLPPLDPPEK